MEQLEIIHAYSRKDAIEDGVLLDITEFARDFGILYPTAMTAGAFEACVAVPPAMDFGDMTGRLIDVLYRFRDAAKSSTDDVVVFRVGVRNAGRLGCSRLVALRAVVGPGDDAEAVVTIMLPHED